MKVFLSIEVTSRELESRTLLASYAVKNGFDVIWDDGNADLKTFDKWYLDLIKVKPNLIFMEGTTPVMHFLWDLSKKIKKDLPNTVLVIGGYHAMRQPQETLLKSNFDIVLNLFQ